MDLKKELSKIKEKIENGKQVTPEEVKLFCKMQGAIITTGKEEGEIRVITSFCPQGGLLNICVFEFNEGKGKRVCNTAVFPSLAFEKQLLAIMQYAREEWEEEEVEGLYI